MLEEYWEKRALAPDDWGRELAALGVAAGEDMEVIARLIAGQGSALVSGYRFRAPTGEAGAIIVCHDLGRGLIILGTSRRWGRWDEDYEVLTLDESGEKYDFAGNPVHEGDDGSCSLGNF